MINNGFWIMLIPLMIFLAVIILVTAIIIIRKKKKDKSFKVYYNIYLYLHFPLTFLIMFSSIIFAIQGREEVSSIKEKFGIFLYSNDTYNFGYAAVTLGIIFCIIVLIYDIIVFVILLKHKRSNVYQYDPKIKCLVYICIILDILAYEGFSLSNCISTFTLNLVNSFGVLEYLKNDVFILLTFIVIWCVPNLIYFKFADLPFSPKVRKAQQDREG